MGFRDFFGGFCVAFHVFHSAAFTCTGAFRFRVPMQFTTQVPLATRRVVGYSGTLNPKPETAYSCSMEGFVGFGRLMILERTPKP